MLGDGFATVDGLEKNIQVNYLGHFLLTLLIEDKLKMAASEDCKKVQMTPWLVDDRKQKLLWEISKKLVKLD
jgi:hypothetical protein